MKKRVMHNTIAHHPLTGARPSSWTQIALPPCPSFQVTPPVYALDLTFYGVGQPFAQFKSPFLAMFPPVSFPLCTSSLAEHDTQNKQKKNPWLQINTT